MEFNYLIYLKFLIAIFTVVNPIGVLPIYSSKIEGLSKEDKKVVRRTASLAIFIILIVSMFLGQYILQFFSISLNSFRIAGGILITITAFTMISGKINEEKQNPEEKKDLNNIKNFTIVPLAIPIMVGPGAISTAIVWGVKYDEWADYLGLMLAILAFSMICYGLFKSSDKFVSILGKTGSNVVTRLMGLVLMALGVEILTTGLVDLYTRHFSPLMS